jgi:uncharacterized protein (TIGR00369 family)
MFEIKNPGWKEGIEKILQRQNFMYHIGMVITRMEPGEIEGHLPFREILKQQSGFLHGGAIATICDIVSGLAAYSLVNADEFVVTSDLKISYLNPGTGSGFKARGWVLKPGSRMHFCEAEVVEEGSGLLIAKASSTMVTLPVQQSR